MNIDKNEGQKIIIDNSLEATLLDLAFMGNILCGVVVMADGSIETVEHKRIKFHQPKTTPTPVKIPSPLQTNR